MFRFSIACPHLFKLNPGSRKRKRFIIFSEPFVISYFYQQQIAESNVANICGTNRRIIWKIQIFEHIQHPSLSFLPLRSLSSNSLRNRSKRILRSNIKDVSRFTAYPSPHTYVYLSIYVSIFTFSDYEQRIHNAQPFACSSTDKSLFEIFLFPLVRWIS